MVINIVFQKTAQVDAEPELLFYDDFDGNALDGTKWATCPNWDRQGRSTWDSSAILRWVKPKHQIANCQTIG
jgi:hypothetical protein